MKTVIAFYFFVYAIPLYAQQVTVALPILPSATLVAGSSKHIRSYVNGELIKIHYHIGGQIIEAKGILNITDTSRVYLLPVRKGAVVIINAGSISSIGLWKRRGKIDAAIFGGTAVLAAGVAALAINPNRQLGKAQTLVTFYWYCIHWELFYMKGLPCHQSIYLNG